jgi:hypothetical protein
LTLSLALSVSSCSQFRPQTSRWTCCICFFHPGPSPLDHPPVECQEQGYQRVHTTSRKSLFHWDCPWEWVREVFLKLCKASGVVFSAHLNHEALYISMKYCAIVVPTRRQCQEVLSSFGSLTRANKQMNRRAPISSRQRQPHSPDRTADG